MTLRRTVSALASMHVFYKADVVVFCEGGHSKSHAEALNHSNDSRTLDGVFWSSVMGLFVEDKKLHFKSVGSKSTLTAISSDVHSSGIRTVTVCLDSDYDRILNRHLKNDRLAYTCGYSWESDVMQGNVLEEILLVLVGPVSNELLEFLRESIRKIEKDLVQWCEIDISLKHRDKPCVFDRKNPLSSIDINNYPICVAQQRLSRRLSEECGYIRRPKSVKKIQADSVRSVAFGKMISKSYYHLLLSVAKRVMADIKIEYDNIMRLAINFTVREIALGNRDGLRSHYAAQCVAF